MPSPSAFSGGDIASPSLWDPLVRLTHWTIAAAVILNGLLDEPGKTLHVWIGWGALAALLVRLIWGIIGPAEARFSAFLPDPKAGMAHLLGLLRREPPCPYPSHNPAGALMVYALWALLAMVIATGLIMTDAQSPMQVAAENAAVAAGDWSVLAKAAAVPDSAWTKGLKHGAELLHGASANLMLILALVHVAGVIVEGRAMKRNLVKPMLFGERK